MLEQRNAFINVIHESIISQKKRFQSILNKLGWTLQNVADPVKVGNDEETNNELLNYSGNKNPHNHTHNDNNVAERESSKEKRSLDVKIVEGCPFPLNGISHGYKRYSELLGTLSFQPKVKKEKLSDTQLLASLLESERNAKRRRISYRNKVHTKNKSQTEVLREVIREQMEVLKNEEEESKDTNSILNENKEEDGMLEVNVLDGNPHLAWQTVGLVVGDQLKAREKHRENYRTDRHTSKSEYSSTYHRKYRYSKSSPKHRHRSPYYRDKNLKHHSSRDSRRHRSSSQEYHSRSENKHSKQYSNRKCQD